MTKREREALREYVNAVCGHTYIHGYRAYSPQPPSFEIDGKHVGYSDALGETAERLNAADDRIRALGMLR